MHARTLARGRRNEIQAEERGGGQFICIRITSQKYTQNMSLWNKCIVNRLEPVS